MGGPWGRGRRVVQCPGQVDAPSSLTLSSHFPPPQSWLRQYKLDYDAVLVEYSSEFDIRHVPTPADFVGFLRHVSVGKCGICCSYNQVPWGPTLTLHNYHTFPHFPPPPCCTAGCPKGRHSVAAGRHVHVPPGGTHGRPAAPGGHGPSIRLRRDGPWLCGHCQPPAAGWGWGGKEGAAMALLLQEGGGGHWGGVACCRTCCP